MGTDADLDALSRVPRDPDDPSLALAGHLSTIVAQFAEEVGLCPDCMEKIYEALPAAVRSA